MSIRVAVLVDGDNISPTYAEQIRRIAERQGAPDVLRVYADANRNSDWHHAHGYRLMHAGIGKNATDLLLTIDAMELAFSGDFSAFAIASSDGDFTHLALRLRERGLPVTGIGEAKAPHSFRSACTSFDILGSKTKNPTTPTLVARPNGGGTSDLDWKIREMIAVHSKKGEGIRITDLAPKMHQAFGTRISTHPERTWRAYLEARTDLYDLDPRGPEAKVRFKPKGFASAA